MGLAACTNASVAASEREQVVFNFYVVEFRSTREEIYFGTQIISGVSELKNFLHDNQVNFGFRHNEDFSSNNFASVFIRYDARFFASNILVVHGTVAEPTHGVNYRLVKNYLSGGVMDIEIERYGTRPFVQQAVQHFIFLIEICMQDIVVNDVNIVITRLTPNQ